MSITGRWEWRTFGEDLASAEARLAALTARRGARRATRCTSPAAHASVKFRDDVVDVKGLEQVDEDGLEQWRPVLKAALPLSGGDVGLLDALDVAAAARRRRTTLEELSRACSAGCAPSSAQDRGTTGGGCLAELTELRDRRRTRTIAVESEDPARVVAAVRELGLAVRRNTCSRAGSRRCRLGAPRYAVIDVGTNSVKFHLAERPRRRRGRRSSTAPRSRGSARASTRPGSSSRSDGARSTRSPAWSTRRTRAGVEAIAAVGTAGMRIASNADEFVDAVRARTGVEIEVISGEEEAGSPTSP